MQGSDAKSLALLSDILENALKEKLVTQITLIQSEQTNQGANRKMCDIFFKFYLELFIVWSQLNTISKQYKNLGASKSMLL